MTIWDIISDEDSNWGGSRGCYEYNWNLEFFEMSSWEQCLADCALDGFHLAGFQGHTCGCLSQALPHFSLCWGRHVGSTGQGENHIRLSSEAERYHFNISRFARMRWASWWRSWWISVSAARPLLTWNPSWWKPLQTSSTSTSARSAGNNMVTRPTTAIVKTSIGQTRDLKQWNFKISF